MANSSDLSNELPAELKQEIFSLVKCVFCRNKLIFSHDEFVGAKLLECCHSVCRECINKWTENEKKECPLCTLEVERKFLDNIILQEIVDNSSIQNNSKSFCGVHSTCPTTHFCYGCADFLCEECIKYHSQLKETKSHILKTKEEYANDPSIRFMCKTHPKETLKLYCFTCDVLTCRDCQLYSHRDHHYDFVKDLVDKAKIELHSENIILRYNLRLLESSLPIINERKAALNNEGEVIKQQINELADVLIKKINKKRSNLLARLRQITRNQTEMYNTRQNEIEKKVRALKHCTCFATNVLKNSSDCSVVQSKAHILNYMDKMKSFHEDMLPNPSCKKMIHFKENVSTVLPIINGVAAISLLDFTNFDRAKISDKIAETSITHEKAYAKLINHEDVRNEPEEERPLSAESGISSLGSGNSKDTVPSSTQDPLGTNPLSVNIKSEVIYSEAQRQLISQSPQPTYQSPQPTYHSPKPTYLSPKPTYQSPQPTFQSQQPTYQSPQPTFQSQQPTYQSPQPTYQSPQPAYQSPRRNFQSPQPNFQAITERINAHLNNRDLPTLPSMNDESVVSQPPPVNIKTEVIYSEPQQRLPTIKSPQKTLQLTSEVTACRTIGRDTAPAQPNRVPTPHVTAVRTITKEVGPPKVPTPNVTINSQILFENIQQAQAIAQQPSQVTNTQQAQVVQPRQVETQPLSVNIKSEMLYDEAQQDLAVANQLISEGETPFTESDINSMNSVLMNDNLYGGTEIQSNQISTLNQPISGASNLLAALAQPVNQMNPIIQTSTIPTSHIATMNQTSHIATINHQNIQNNKLTVLSQQNLQNNLTQPMLGQALSNNHLNAINAMNQMSLDRHMRISQQATNQLRNQMQAPPYDRTNNDLLRHLLEGQDQVLLPNAVTQQRPRPPPPAYDVKPPQATPIFNPQNGITTWYPHRPQAPSPHQNRMYIQDNAYRQQAPPMNRPMTPTMPSLNESDICIVCWNPRVNYKCTQCNRMYHKFPCYINLERDNIDDLLGTQHCILCEEIQQIHKPYSFPMSHMERKACARILLELLTNRQCSSFFYCPGTVIESRLANIKSKLQDYSQGFRNGVDEFIRYLKTVFYEIHRLKKETTGDQVSITFGTTLQILKAYLPDSLNDFKALRPYSAA